MSTKQREAIMDKLDSSIKTVMNNKTILKSASDSIREIKEGFILRNAQVYSYSIEHLIYSGTYELHPDCK